MWNVNSQSTYEDVYEIPRLISTIWNVNECRNPRAYKDEWVCYQLYGM